MTTIDKLAGLVACAVATGDPADPSPLITYMMAAPREHLELVRSLRVSTRETLNDRIRRELEAVKGEPLAEDEVEAL